MPLQPEFQINISASIQSPLATSSAPPKSYTIARCTALDSNNNPIYIISSQITTIILTSSMSATLRMRERLEQSRRTCLLRKVRLCEYLLGYTDALECRRSPNNATANSFFPHINYHVSSAPVSPNKKEQLASSLLFSADVPLRTPAVRTTSTGPPRTALRPSSRQPPAMDISELTTKTLTPSSRMASGEDSSFTTRGHRSTILTEREKTTFRRMSPRKRTYVGGACFVKDQSIAKPQVGGERRKMSIAPWEIDAQFN